MTTWDIAWRIGFFIAISVACLAIVVRTEREAAEKWDVIPDLTDYQALFEADERKTR